MCRQTSETEFLTPPSSRSMNRLLGKPDLRNLPEIISGILLLFVATEVKLISSRSFERCVDKFDAWLDNVNLDA